MVQNVFAVPLYMFGRAQPGLAFGMGQNSQSRTAKHRLYGAMIGNPPVGGIFRIIFLYEIHAGERRVGEDLLVPKMVVVTEFGAGKRTANHRLKDKPAASFYFLDDLVQSVEWITEMIEKPHEQDIIELSGYLVHVINRALLKFDIQAQHLCGKGCLAEIAIIHVHAENATGISLPEFE